MLCSAVLLSLQRAFDLSYGTRQEQQSLLKQTGLQPGRLPRGRAREQWKKVCVFVCVCVWTHRISKLNTYTLEQFVDIMSKEMFSCFQTLTELTINIYIEKIIKQVNQQSK